DESGEAGFGAKPIAQPIGFAGAHGMSGIFAVRQAALEPHQRRDIARLRRAHANRRHILMSSTLPILPVELDGGVGVELCPPISLTEGVLPPLCLW
ncbi:MAG: hypothetical protein WBE84_17585, partial [Xanthobacteraceae bacterium]